MLVGAAAAGRGNTHFFLLDGHPLVLRHYRRGGLVRHFSERHYLWLGLARTRAVREFELLRALEAEGLPVPPPFACAVSRRGPFWRGSLVTRRLPGRTLAEMLDAAARGEGGEDGEPSAADGRLDAVLWEAVGRAVARLHAAGVRHADLNAHNVLIDPRPATANGPPSVHLLDFDRATRRPTSPDGRIARWQRGNVARLAGSLRKLAATNGRAFDAGGFAMLEAAWTRTLRRGPWPLGKP